MLLVPEGRILGATRGCGAQVEGSGARGSLVAGFQFKLTYTRDLG